MTVIHIFTTVFWLGWIVFLFLILNPVATGLSGIHPPDLMGAVRRRVRGVIFWFIPIIVLTGLYNMGYRGLLDWSMLTSTGIGMRMLWKLGAAAVLIAIYYLAPRIMAYVTGRSADSRDQSSFNPKTIVKTMHVIAFSAGTVAAYLGVTIGG